MATKPKFDLERGVWRMQYQADGKWHRVNIGRPARWKKGDPEPRKMPPEVLARALQLQAREEESRKAWGQGIPDSLARFLRDHVSRYAKETTRAVAEASVDPFLDWCRERRVIHRTQVDADLCAEYIDHLASTLSIGTVTTRVAYLARAWGRLVKRGKIAKSPWSGLELHGLERTKPKNAWTPEQFAQLLAGSKADRYEWLRDVLTFGTQTGIRIGAMMALTWDDWKKPQSDAEGFGYLDVRTEINKTKGYMVPVSRKLYELLTRRYGKHDRTFILAGAQGRPLKSRQHTEMAIRLACKRAGLPTPESPNHHMRRSFGRWAITGYLTGRPVPIYVVSQWMGHATIEMTMEYLGLEKHQSVSFMVPDLGGPDPTPSAPTPPGATSPSA